MSVKLKEKILSIIAGTPIPEHVLDGESNLVSAGMISDLLIEKDRICFVIEINPDHARLMEEVSQLLSSRIRESTGINKVTIALTAEVSPSRQNKEAGKPAGFLPANRKAATSASGHSGKKALPNIKHIIAIASGKGGVGKSTVSVNLAVALQQTGLKVGLLDADIYGPSLPVAWGLSHKKPETREDKIIIPLEAFGVKLMSIGFLVAEERAMIWRGPMVQSALKQLLYKVDWGELDILVIDMPPGTGDAHLTLVQIASLTGAIIVTTPQDLALLDARKAIDMFLRVKVPLLGLVENMSQFTCPNCGQVSHIFGKDGAYKEADKLKIPFLGAFPLVIEVRESMDAGIPLLVSKSNTRIVEAYEKLAEKVRVMIKEGQ